MIKILTPEILAILKANGEDRKDRPPVVKLFNPVGAATWLFSEIDEDGDTLYGLCDLGFGCPELGYQSLAELQSVRLSMGMSIEMDHQFSSTRNLTEWAERARAAGSIMMAQNFFRREGRL